MTTAEGTIGRRLGWLLAVLSGAAGMIHLATAGAHFEVTWAHGLFFAVVGWAQVALAVAVVVRPERPALLGLLGLGVVVPATWLVSRTLGVPFGPDAGEAEPVGLADALATGFELVTAVVAAAALARPAVAERPAPRALAQPALALACVLVAGVSTLSLTPDFASGHAHGSSGDDHGTDAGGGEGHGHGMAEGHTAAGHGGAGHDAPVIAADGTSPCEQAGVSNEGNSGGHGHRGPVAHEPLDRQERRERAEQQAAANAVVEALPTVADAEAAGYRKVSPYVPCIAAHYIRSDLLLADGFDPAMPEVVLYAGTDPDSEVVGLSYLVRDEEEPEGFAGADDPWHVHERLCLGDGGVIGIETATEEECEARGGEMRDVGNIWMTHMWNVPGWESSWGLFSAEHPDLGGRIGDIDAPPDPDADGTWFEESDPADRDGAGGDDDGDRAGAPSS